MAWTIAMLVLAITHGPASAGSDHSNEKKMQPIEASGFTVTWAKSPAPAPGVNSAAVYLMLENGTEKDVQLVAVESDAFVMGHIHKTSMTDGLMSMAPVAQLTVPASKTVTLEPNGLHIMLMGPKHKFTAGDQFPLSLVLDNSHHIKAVVNVVKPGDVLLHGHADKMMN